jgi:glycosyltransferase involved in cell wall biosynthesis
MKILIICPHFLDQRLGGSKAYIEIHDEYRKLGIDAHIVGPDVYYPDFQLGMTAKKALATKKYIEKVQNEFDLIEIEHNQLPLAPRWKPGKRPILIGRSTLLTHLVCKYRAFDSYGWHKVKMPFQYIKTLIKDLIACMLATRSCKNFDFILCSNQDEVEVLSQVGIHINKIGFSPFGLSYQRINALVDARKSVKIDPKLVGMVGTFDPRKGLGFLPKLFDSLINEKADISFRLIGTGKYIPRLENQFERFSKKVRSRLQIIQVFDPDDLPKLISEFGVGIFPSLVEGCPFGLLEMVGAGISVVGFNSPGVSMVLPDDCCIPSNNLDSFKLKVLSVISANINGNFSNKCFSEQFLWTNICSETLILYEKILRSSKKIVEYM